MSPHDPHMTEAQQRRLDSLYREHGEAEPDAGLDRIIRARADEAARTVPVQRRPRWLGAAATAAVAVVAIGVVIQQAPLGPEPTESDGAAPVAEELQDADDTVILERSEPDQGEAGGATQDRAGIDSTAQRRPAPDSARTTPESESPGPPPEYRRREAESTASVTAAPLQSVSESAPAATPRPEAGLLYIQALIEIGEIDRARDQLDALLALYPDTPVPEAMVEALATEAPE